MIDFLIKMCVSGYKKGNFTRAVFDAPITESGEETCVRLCFSFFVFFAKPGTTIDNQNESIVNHIKPFSVLN